MCAAQAGKTVPILTDKLGLELPPVRFAKPQADESPEYDNDMKLRCSLARSDTKQWRSMVHTHQSSADFGTDATPAVECAQSAEVPEAGGRDPAESLSAKRQRLNPRCLAPHPASIPAVALSQWLNRYRSRYRIHFENHSVCPLRSPRNPNFRHRTARNIP